MGAQTIILRACSMDLY